MVPVLEEPFIFFFFFYFFYLFFFFWRSPLEESDTQASNFKARSVIVEVWIKSEEEAGSWSREHLFGAST